MRYVRWLSPLLFASTLAVGIFTSSTASAVPCCSAPICQQDDPPPICSICSDCSADEADAFADEVVYEEFEEEVCWLGEAE